MMISSITRQTFCRNNSTSIVCKRFVKKYKWSVIKAVNQYHYENEQLYGPPIKDKKVKFNPLHGNNKQDEPETTVKQGKNSVVKDKNVKFTEKHGSEVLHASGSNQNFPLTEKDKKDTVNSVTDKRTRKSKEYNTRSSNTKDDEMRNNTENGDNSKQNTDKGGTNIQNADQGDTSDQNTDKGDTSDQNTDKGDTSKQYYVNSDTISESEKLLHNHRLSPFSFILKYPLLQHKDDIDCSLLKQSTEMYVPAVTKIISETQSDLQKFYLERWKRNMISEMGEEKFKEYQQETFRNGSLLHHNIQSYFSGEPEEELEIPSDIAGYWKSISHVLKRCQDPVGIEEPVQHPFLCYKGQFDCVAVYKDKLCVIDWKTSKKVKTKLTDTFDNPIQVAAYIGAVNSSNLLQKKGLQVDQITSGAIVVAYSDGFPANVLIMDKDSCQIYWKKWLERLHTYWSLKNQKSEEAG